MRLVSTPGHTTGHLSVVLRLMGRELLLTGDAAYTMRTITDTALPYRMDDEHFFTPLAARDPALRRAHSRPR